MTTDIHTARQAMISEFRAFNAQIAALKLETPNARDFNSFVEANIARDAHYLVIGRLKSERDAVVTSWNELKRKSLLGPQHEGTA